MLYQHTVTKEIIDSNQMGTYNGNLCVPTHGMLVNLLYEPYQATDEQIIAIDNDIIRQKRQELYKLRSDSLYMAYQKYLALDQVEKAEASRLAWLSEIELIDNENPYTIIENEA